MVVKITKGNCGEKVVSIFEGNQYHCDDKPALKIFSRKGDLKLQMCYIQGLLTDITGFPAKTTFHKNGRVSGEYHFIAGYNEGTSFEFDDQGKITAEFVYSAGKLIKIKKYKEGRLIYFLENNGQSEIVIDYEKEVTLKYDTQLRLHSASGYALKWKTGEAFFLHGRLIKWIEGPLTFYHPHKVVAHYLSKLPVIEDGVLDHTYLAELLV